MHWYIFLEDATTLNLPKFIQILQQYSSPTSENYFLGHSLVDNEYAVTHHYQPGLNSIQGVNVNEVKYMDGSSDGILRYPDIGAGMILSSKLVNRFV
jgi:hypothetical protein